MKQENINLLKKGDKVVCVEDYLKGPDLVEGKVYTVDSSFEMYHIDWLEINHNIYEKIRFLSLKEYRKQKLLKIKENS